MTDNLKRNELLRVKGMRKSKTWINCVGMGEKNQGINSDRFIRKCSQIWNELSWIKCNRI